MSTYERINKLLGTRYKSDEEIDLCNILSSIKISEEFIEEFKDKIYKDHWYYISMNPNLTEEFIRRYEDNIDFKAISSTRYLSEDFIMKYEYKLNISSISNYRCLNEEIIEKHVNEIPSWNLSSYQVLSEDFIRRHENRLSWGCISTNQLLSWDFMLEFKDRLDWDCISGFQPFIDPEFPEINKDRLRNNKLYKLYQIIKDRGWFIGYIELDDISNHERDRSHYFYIDPSDLIRDWEIDYVKVRLHWKDIVMTRGVKDYEPIRLFKYV